jgi:hypothetical protein
MGMSESLHHLRQVMLLSGVSCVALGALLLLLTVWRPRWRKLLAAEAAFWGRLGFGGRWGAPLRRFEESRAVVLAVAALLVLHLLLLLFAAGAYGYFAPRLRQKPPAPLTPQPLPPRRS